MTYKTLSILFICGYFAAIGLAFYWKRRAKKKETAFAEWKSNALAIGYGMNKDILKVRKEAFRDVDLKPGKITYIGTPKR